MEELLNKLIEKGWKPRNKDYIVKLYIKYGDIQLRRGTENRPNEEVSRAIMSKRELVSKESGLWQFCIKNGLVEVDNHIPTLWEKRYKAPGVESIYKNDIHFEKEFEYRLIESSLKDESELEDFLLNSIKLKYFDEGNKTEHIFMEEDTLQELRDLGKI